MRNPTDVECFDLGMNCCLEKSLTPSAAFLCVCVLTIRIDAVALVSRSTSQLACLYIYLFGCPLVSCLSPASFSVCLSDSRSFCPFLLSVGIYECVSVCLLMPTSSSFHFNHLYLYHTLNTGQSNSEHSRHWFFGGKMIIDGEEKKETLFGMVKSTLPAVSNSVIAFHDNSSVSRCSCPQECSFPQRCYFSQECSFSQQFTYYHSLVVYFVSFYHV